jgi:thioredoxin-like negative regulator of GroEL
MNSLRGEQFEEAVLNNRKNAIVLFSNEWNGSVVILRSTLTELEKKYKNEIDFFEIEEQLASDLHEKFAIKKIPTIFVFKSSEIYRVIEGIPSKSELTEVIESLI